MLLEQARELEDSGDFAMAAELYGRLLADQPDDPAVLSAIGRLLGRRGQLDAAVAHYAQATSLCPSDPGLWLDFGLLLGRTGHDEMAKRALLSAASLNPEDPSLLSALADSLRERRLFEDAARQYRRLTEIMPSLAAAHNNLGITLLDLGRRNEAFEPFRRAAEIDCNMPEAISNLAMLTVERGQNEAAVGLYAHLRQLRPDLVQAPLNQGVAFYRMGRLNEAAAALKAAVALEPDNAQARYDLAQVLLLKGDWTEGFREYEWRWRYSGFPSQRLLFFQPLWQGERLANGTLLVHAEQGLGDSLQFCRLLPLAAQACGGKVIFLCPPPLTDILSGLENVLLVPEDQEPPPFDAYCPLLSLAHLLEPGFGVSSPYLFAPLAKNFARQQGKLNVGLIWAGNPKHGRDFLRSLPLEMLSRLPGHDGIAYHSLQYQPAEGWRDAFATPIEDQSPAIAGFADLADAMAAMDLVISIDSAPAHLAGALGRPCWLLLHHLPDWRWGMAGAETPWYPSLRLYRQSQPRDWGNVIDRVAADLIRLADAGRR